MYFLNMLFGPFLKEYGLNQYATINNLNPKIKMGMIIFLNF